MPNPWSQKVMQRARRDCMARGSPTCCLTTPPCELAACYVSPGQATKACCVSSPAFCICHKFLRKGFLLREIHIMFLVFCLLQLLQCLLHEGLISFLIFLS